MRFFLKSRIMLSFFCMLLSPAIYPSSESIALPLLMSHRDNPSMMALNAMATFNQTNSGSGNASQITKVTFGFFTSADCTGNALKGEGVDDPLYTADGGNPFGIQLSTDFWLVARSVWNVGNNQLLIPDMTQVQTVAVTFYSTSERVPQSNFSGVNFACISVTCTAGPNGECTSALGTQSFTLKTTASIGDPADGGIIGCMGGGANNLVVASTDNSASIQWSPSNTDVPTATSVSNGESNTTEIVNTVGVDEGTNYAAYYCKNTYQPAGGYTSGWFLPASGAGTSPAEQFNCFFDTNEHITTLGFTGAYPPYWSSTQGSGIGAYARYGTTADTTWYLTQKITTARLRCARNY